jgi:predicted enzyme related to lactoylglutathione lyase
MAKNDEGREEHEVDKRLARHGHVSYLEVPAVDAEQSAAFYEAVFGWAVERREDGRRSFDDRSGDLIGRWATDRVASREAGLLPYIMSIASTRLSIESCAEAAKSSSQSTRRETFGSRHFVIQPATLWESGRQAPAESCRSLAYELPTSIVVAPASTHW